jgi:hypothetical protein
VSSSLITNTSASGSAIRSLNSYYKLRNLEIENNLSNKANKIIKPQSENFNIYRNLLSRYAKLEKIVSEILNKI